jgi:hypothetical protein
VVRFELSERSEGGTHLKIVHGGFVVASDRPVDAVAEAAEDMVVLLPIAALMRRRARRSRRCTQFMRHSVPTVMRLAA